MCVCVCVCVRAGGRACVRSCVRARLRVCMYTAYIRPLAWLPHTYLAAFAQSRNELGFNHTSFTKPLSSELWSDVLLRVYTEDPYVYATVGSSSRRGRGVSVIVRRLTHGACEVGMRVELQA